MILLDTNVVSELTKPAPEPRVVRWLASHEPQLALSSITLAELRYGIARLPVGRRKASLEEFWSLTQNRFAGRIHAFDESAAEAYGDLAAEAERLGRRIPVLDGMIAAIAKTHGLAVATRDADHFHTAAIPVVDPWRW